MTVIFESGYTLPGSDQPLTHARIAHSGNWLTGGTASAGSTATGFYVDAPTNSLTYEFWKPSGAAPISWEYDHGSSAECDYCAVAAHDMGTNVAEFKAQYWNGSAWVNLCPATAITNDGPIFVIFEPVTAQRWRIRFDSYTAAPKVGVIRFGSAMQMTQPIFGGHTPIEWARQTVLRTNRSDTGEFLGRTKQRTYRETQFSWTHIQSSWMQTNWADFQQAVESEPFFVAWRPDSRSGVAYGVTDQPPIPSNMGVKAYMEVTLNVRARGYD